MTGRLFDDKDELAEIEKLMEKRERLKLRVGIAIAAIFAFIIFYLLFDIMTLEAEELHTYRVWGRNQHTGLMVAGWMWEQGKDGLLKAKIMDELQEFEECNGSWVGYGVARIGCENGHQYQLEVVR